MTWEHILKKILEAIKPQEEDRVTRSQVIDELRGVIESVETLKGNLIFHCSVKSFFIRFC